jgi:hypothetical protein
MVCLNVGQKRQYVPGPYVIFSPSATSPGCVRRNIVRYVPAALWMQDQYNLLSRLACHSAPAGLSAVRP